ncbi:unnamed protein product [Cylindrotheca closterium]|uniref:Uncharacterized protein n=1 Tax=Cylindrotheca closterium TaxID=2856 RepID=A0AAD2FRV6_9STRA|nr:unnamed protein product [Cylindrotheca closterium]
MNIVPSSSSLFWRNKNPLKRRRRRRRLKTKVYVILLVGTCLIILHIYEHWQWSEFRNVYWTEELLVYDGGGYNRSGTSSPSSASNNKNNNNLRAGGGTNNENHNKSPKMNDNNRNDNPNAKWNPEIIFTHRDVHLSEQADATATTKSATFMEDTKNKASFVRDSRQSIQFSDFVNKPNDNDNDNNDNTKQQDVSSSSLTYEQAKEGREPLLEILEHDLGLAKLTTTELLQLPKWSEIQDLYGSKPMLVGTDTCLKYQTKVPLQDRYIGVAGSFNSGTTAFGLSLQQNCRFPNRRHSRHNRRHNRDTQTAGEGNNKNPAGNIVTNVHGMLNQVPWAKHKMARERFGHTIDESIPKENVLPVVLVRDPYYWMQSMCKQGYGVRWDHNAKKHCPNLVPNEYDQKRFKRYASLNQTSVPVWMGQSYESGPHWDSLVHYWNDWYGSYYYNNNNSNNDNDNHQTANNNHQEDFPRLMIRFEDTLFHAKTVMKLVCACGGGIFSGNEDEEEDDGGEINIGFTNDNTAKQQQQQQHQMGSAFRPIVDEAKFEHKHVQNNLVSAIVKYGTEKGRYRNMTQDDLEFAQTHLDSELMKAFHYKQRT